jgi:ribokinase
MKTGPTFCVVGSLNIDFVVPVPTLPHEGETLFGGSYEMIPGGKGANQAVSIARLGESVSLIGKVGRDEFGTALRSSLSAEGIDVAGVHVASAVRTGCAFVVVADSGKNMIVVSPGANAAWTPAEVEDVSRGAAASACVLLQGEIPPFVNLAVARAARAANSRVIWNPAPAYLDRDLLALTDVVVPNELEAFQLAAALKRPTESIRDAASTLLDHGPGAVVVTMGSEGAWLATREGSARFPARSIQVVDTTAAGDAFVGGMAVALFRGLELPQAVAWGNAAGALAASRWGAQPSLPTAEELRTLVEAP